MPLLYLIPWSDGPQGIVEDVHNGVFWNQDDLKRKILFRMMIIFAMAVQIFGMLQHRECHQ